MSMMASTVDVQNNNSPGKPIEDASMPMEVAYQPTSNQNVSTKTLNEPVSSSVLKPTKDAEEDSPSRSVSPADSGISSLPTTDGNVITESMLAEEQNLQEEGKEEEKKLEEQALNVWEKELEEQRYKRLQHLLEKSSIYSNFLLAKMDEQQESQKKRQAKMNKTLKREAEEKKKQEAEEKKAAEQQKPTQGTPRRTRRGGKTDQDSSSEGNDSQKSTPGRSTRSGGSGNQETTDKSTAPAAAGKKGKSKKRKASQSYTIADYLDRGALAKRQKNDQSASKDTESNASKSKNAKDKTQAVNEDHPATSKEAPEMSTQSTDEAQTAPTAPTSTAPSSKPGEFVDTFSRTINGEKISDRQPDLFTGGVLRDYQLEGMEWLKVLYENGVNGILGDEMGLGKTVQCISLLAHIIKMGVPGPFLVCAPLSTLPNWLSEFERFTPEIPVILYHGSQPERQKLRRKIFKKHGEFNVQPVVITSYEIVMRDRKGLQHFLWKYIVIDEGHRIKNLNCRLISELKCYQSANRLLLTGTPLQNNLSELWSMLNFLLPEVFDDLRTFESWFDFGTLCKEGGDEIFVAKEREKHVVSMLHQILTPFLLRRLKSDVELVIPPKKEILVHAPLTAMQQEYYRTTVDRTILSKIKEKKDGPEAPVELTPSGRRKRKSCVKVDYAAFGDDDTSDEPNPDKETQEEIDRWMERLEKAVERPSEAASTKGPKKAEYSIKMINIMMQLRKCCNHPYLLEYPLIPETQQYRIDEEIVTSCGKFQVLDRMLPALKERGHKVLLFSQMTTMLDIIEDFCLYRNHSYCRLDGRMAFADRQQQISDYNKDPNKFIFLLSTRAGGLGINLTAADTVIIYDSDWNPQCDLQAQDRCHRIGQTKPVVVYRMVTANTIDQEIVERASAKRRLEKMVIHQGKFKGGQKNIAKDSKSIVNPKELLELLRSRDHSGEIKNSSICDKDLELLLDRSDLVAKHNAALAGKAMEKKKKGKQAKVVKETELFKVIDDEDEETAATELRILT
ncbi:lymphoid-specific helicase-like [Amphiura filiformis]|uniref:lymphoid-specific helicase-like n=1 Tax=Amphiura filiformis TaxID=82378 RepID=UPI003B21FBAF